MYPTLWSSSNIKFYQLNCNELEKGSAIFTQEVIHARKYRDKEMIPERDKTFYVFIKFGKK